MELLEKIKYKCLVDIALEEKKDIYFLEKELKREIRIGSLKRESDLIETMDGIPLYQTDGAWQNYNPSAPPDYENLTEKILKRIADATN